MTTNGFLQLAINTVKAPRDVARLLLSLNLPANVLWLLFSLVIVLNTLVFSVSILATPSFDLVVPLLSSPVVFGALLALSVGFFVGAATWCGRPLGGNATYAQIGILVIWLQSLRVLLQVAVIVLAPVSIILSGVLVSAASIIGIWIFLNFIDVAHGFNNRLKAGMVMVMAVIAMMLGLSLIFSILGVQPGGIPGYV